MANLRAAKKSIKQDKKRHDRNTAIKSDLKTTVKKLNNLIDSNKADEAAKQLSVVMSKLDKAVKKNIIRHHTADRSKSRLAAKIVKLKKS
ncbi:MAG: 30S ribosomal protein S20 [Candidatus Omnitrophota bacterium]